MISSSVSVDITQIFGAFVFSFVPSPIPFEFFQDPGPVRLILSRISENLNDAATLVQTNALVIPTPEYMKETPMYRAAENPTSWSTLKYIYATNNLFSWTWADSGPNFSVISFYGVAIGYNILQWMLSTIDRYRDINLPSNSIPLATLVHLSFYSHFLDKETNDTRRICQKGMVISNGDQGFNTEGDAEDILDAHNSNTAFFKGLELSIRLLITGITLSTIPQPFPSLLYSLPFSLFNLPENFMIPLSTTIPLLGHLSLGFLCREFLAYPFRTIRHNMQLQSIEYPEVLAPIVSLSPLMFTCHLIHNRGLFALWDGFPLYLSSRMIPIISSMIVWFVSNGSQLIF